MNKPPRDRGERRGYRKTADGRVEGRGKSWQCGPLVAGGEARERAGRCGTLRAEACVNGARSRKSIPDGGKDGGGSEQITQRGRGKIDREESKEAEGSAGGEF